MPSAAATIDLDHLVLPIRSDNPCGENLKYEACWTELSDYRKARTDPLDSSKDKIPNWPRVFALSSELLDTKSKDLMLAGWLTDASTRLYGFPGLRDGLRLIQGLVDRYWECVHPLPDGADFSTRAAPLYWLTSDDSGARLPIVLRDISLVPSSTDTVLNWKYWHLRRPEQRGKEEKEEVYVRRCHEAEKFKQLFDAAVAAAPVPHFQALDVQLKECLTEIDKLGAMLDKHLKDDSPNWNGLRKVINDIAVFVHDVLKQRGGLPADPQPKDDPTRPPGGPTEGSAAGGPIRSRSDAVIRLEEVAQYFSTAEPHSPVAYLVRRAIRWSGMPFADVLNELVKDPNLVKQIGETLGIVPETSKKP